MKHRKHFSHLPNAKVLDEALGTEAKRAVPKNKQRIHYPKFDLFLSWMDNIGVGTEFFEKATGWQEIINTGNEIRELVVRKTAECLEKKDGELLSLMKGLENYLGEEDIMPKEADLILVFGSQDLGRIRKAVDIYQNLSIKKILIAGGARYDTKEKETPEAETFKREALRLGVPPSSIIVEPSSITIADNVRSGLNLLDKLGIKYSSMVTMVSWFAQRRAWAHLMKYTNGETVIRVNSDPKSVQLTPGSWYNHGTGINVVFSEFLKMKMAVMLNTA